MRHVDSRDRKLIAPYNNHVGNLHKMLPMTKICKFNGSLQCTVRSLLAHSRWVNSGQETQMSKFQRLSCGKLEHDIHVITLFVRFQLGICTVVLALNDYGSRERVSSEMEVPVWRCYDRNSNFSCPSMYLSIVSIAFGHKPTFGAPRQAIITSLVR